MGECIGLKSYRRPNPQSDMVSCDVGHQLLGAAGGLHSPNERSNPDERNYRYEEYTYQTQLDRASRHGKPQKPSSWLGCMEDLPGDET